MTTDKLLDDIGRDEGFVPSVYLDSEGYQTIGTGHLIDPRVGGKIPKEVDEFWTLYDLKKAFAELDMRFPWWQGMSPRRQDALANMAYNLGLPRLMKFKKMLAALQKGQYNDAAKEALDSKWARQVGNRAIRIADIFKNGE